MKALIAINDNDIHIVRQDTSGNVQASTNGTPVPVAETTAPVDGAAPPVTSVIDAMVRAATGKPIPEGPHGWWDTPQPQGGSTFVVGTFSPDTNGNFPTIPCENGEARLDWTSGIACAPCRIPSGVKSVRFTTYGQPEAAGELKVNVSIARGQFRGDESQTVSNDATIPIEGDVQPGTLLWVNMEKFNPGYVGLRVYVTR